MADGPWEAFCFRSSNEYLQGTLGTKREFLVLDTPKESEALGSVRGLPSRPRHLPGQKQRLAKRPQRDTVLGILMCFWHTR